MSELLTLEGLGLSRRTYERLTQTGQVIFGGGTEGIKTLDDLLRCEPGGLLRLYSFGNPELREVEQRLRLYDLRLPRFGEPPCIFLDEDDTWVRLRKLRASPSWYRRSELMELPFWRVAGPSVILKQRGYATVGQVAAASRQELEAALQGWRSPEDIVSSLNRIETELAHLGYQLATTP